jgi:hypothetical protein
MDQRWGDGVRATLGEQRLVTERDVEFSLSLACLNHEV